MPKSPRRGSPRQPTPFADLNLLLAEFVSRIRATLGDNLIGAYLQGSFALGDFDEHSDADFIVVTRRDLTLGEIPALNAAHQAIHDLPGPWARHIEGSYAPASILRAWTTTPRDPPDNPRPEAWRDPQSWQPHPRAYPFLFLNHGDASLVRSEHDNSLVTRWVLREAGIALTGPPAKTLVDPVDPDAMRAEVREVMAAVIAQLTADPSPLEALWYQGFMSIVFARMLQTLATGEIRSKRAAIAFAKASLAPRWAALVDRGWTQRLSMPTGLEAAEAYATLKSDPLDAAETLAFIQAAPGLEAPPSSEDRAKAILARTLALKRQGPSFSATRPGAQSGRPLPRGGWSPPPIRPNSRGKRG